MSEDGTVTGEADILDDGFSRDLGAALGGGERRGRRWGRRRQSSAGELPEDVPPPPPLPDDAGASPLAGPSGAGQPGPKPSIANVDPKGGEPAPAAVAATEPSDEALALVAMLTGGKAPGSAEAMELAALL
ncbi:MAG: hypothetical protein R2761_25960, partial [Acidimicrobiales bacterium]